MSGLSRFREAAPLEGDTATPGIADPRSDLDPPLRRFLGPRRGPAPGEVCELCAEPIGDDHRHVVDLDQRGILCTCRGCGVLFVTSAAGAGRYRTVPDRYLHVQPFSLSPVAWASLDIPVGIAFVVGNTRLERTVAFYPSPGGATESELPLHSWDEVMNANPVLRRVEPDVEAVLVRNDRTATACFVVPVDRCYELVGRLRTAWRGFDGGPEAREAIDGFFTELAGRARTVRGEDA